VIASGRPCSPVPPQNLHGKEGVGGSSPPEGSAKYLHNGPLPSDKAALLATRQLLCKAERTWSTTGLRVYTLMRPAKGSDEGMWMLQRPGGLTVGRDAATWSMTAPSRTGPTGCRGRQMVRRGSHLRPCNDRSSRTRTPLRLFRRVSPGSSKRPKSASLNHAGSNRTTLTNPHE
jgi:hypothetical protein